MALAAELDTLLASACDRGDVPGVVGLVADRAGLRYASAFGRRSSDADAPMRVDTVCWIASMTKALTSAAALRLVERGVLALEEPLAARVPALADPQVLEGFDAQGAPRLRPARTPLTLLHLLTHTSGHGYEYWSEDLQRVRKAWSLPGIATCRDAALRAPLLFDPGERWEYGIATDWLGKVLEAVTGQRLGTVLREQLLQPLGMQDTVFRLDAARRERLARVHQRAADGALAPTAIEVPQDPEFEMGGGGLYGTAGDYARFLRMILRGGELDGVRVLQAGTIEALCSNRIGALRVHPLRTVSPRMSNDVDFHPGVEKAWTCAFEILLGASDTGLPAGALQWAGFPNTYYWLDRTNGIAGVFFTQIVPFADRLALPLFEQFQRTVYSRLR